MTESPSATLKLSRGRLGYLASLDQRCSLYMHRLISQRLPRKLLLMLEHSGNGILWLLLTPAIWFYCDLTTSARASIANFFIGLWVDLALVGTLKGIVRRPRPVYNLSSDFILVVSVDQYSFPSGHAARVAYVAAFALANSSLLGSVTCLAITYWAIVTALSRAIMGRHYIGDVVAGLFTGIVTTAVVTKGTFCGSGCWLSGAESELLHMKGRDILRNIFKKSELFHR